MRERVRDKDRLVHMVEAMRVIMENKDKHPYEQVVADPIMYYGFVKHVEIVGEACYMLSKEYKDTHDQMDWDAIAAMRHVLVHGYYKIKPEQLWYTLHHDIPDMLPVIEGLLSE